MDNHLLDDVNAHGTQWVMAACGHRCGVWGDAMG